MYRGRFLLFPGRRRNRISLSRTLWRHFFIEGAHLGFLQFVERQLFLFFPQSSRERKRDLFPRKSTTTQARREEKSEKKERTKHTQRETQRERSARVCVKESVRDAKNEDSLENAVRILLHHVLVFFFSFFSPERAIRSFFSFCGFLFSFFSLLTLKLSNLSLFLSMRRNAHETLLERRKSSTSRSTRRKRRLF